MLHSFFSNENKQQQQQQQPPPWSCPPQQQQQDDASSWRLCLEAARSILEHDMAAAGAAPVDHTPNTTPRTEPDVYLVPCRARGLSPLEHNIKNANLIVPKDAVHGQNLYCTNPVCRNGGVRFRYCATCQVPAARRNFSTRHSHGRKAPACSSAPKVTKTTTTPAPTTTTTSRPLKKRPLVVVGKDNNSTKNIKNRKTVPSTQLQDWKRLLHQRPSDLTNRTKMEEWFQEILLVSTPTQENDDTMNDDDDDDQQFQATMEATRRLMRLASKAADSAAASVCREEGCSSSMMESD